jgi:hypothetical protein
MTAAPAGLAASTYWGSIFVGRHAAHAIGFQISAATLGAGTLPAAAGLLARHAGLESLGPFLLGSATLLLVLRERKGGPSPDPSHVPRA